MMVLVHIQVRKTGTDWSVADTIAFGPALSLSLIALGVCIARLSGCYSPKTRWSQLGICFISTALALCMVGLVSSRRYGDQKLARVYFGLLLPNCVCPGLYEAEFMWSVLYHSRIRRTLLSVAIVLCLIVLGLSMWAIMRSDQVLLATGIFLAIMCLFYVGASGTYSYLLFEARKSKFSVRKIFQAGVACCLLLFVSTSILLAFVWVGLCSGDLGLWILFTASSISTIRFPLWVWWRKINTLFGCGGQNERQASFVSLVE